MAVFKRIWSLLRAPLLSNEEATRLAAIVHWVSLVTALGAGSWVFVAPFVFTDGAVRSSAGWLPAVGSLLALSLVRRGRLRTASILTVASLWMATTILVVIQPGLDSSSWPAYVLSICLAGLLLGGRVAVGMAVLVAVTGGVCGYLHERGVLMTALSGTTTLGRWVTGTLVMGAVAAVVLFATRQLRGALAAVSEREERLRSIFDAYADGVMIQEPGGTILEANPEACKIFGYTRDEMVGLDPQAIADEDVLSVWKNPARGQEPAGRLHAEGVGYRKHGSSFALEVEANPIVYNGVRRILSNVQDVTERQAAEESRRVLEGHLQQAQKMDALGRLIGGLAHDFNNHLTVILGHAQMMASGLPQDPELVASVAPIQESAERSASLIRQLLAFSRRQVLQPRVIDLNQIGRRMEDMLQRLLGENVRLEMTLASRLWSVRADPVQIEQVLLNLAVNARDAMAHGGTLTLETGNVYLDREYSDLYPDLEPGPYVMISVADTGVGMEEEIKEHIFEPFFTTKDGLGSGLGLSTVLGIVKQSGGNISVATHPDRGTTFKIYLPRVGGEVETELLVIGSEDVQLKGSETVLLVEDQKMVRGLVRHALEEHGYEVIAADDGRSGLELAQEYSGEIDVILTDVVMPEMGGFEMVARVRRKRPEVRVLYMTGYTEEGIVHQGGLDEAQALIQKPFTSLDMLRSLRGVLDAARSPDKKTAEDRMD